MQKQTNPFAHCNSKGRAVLHRDTLRRWGILSFSEEIYVHCKLTDNISSHSGSSSRLWLEKMPMLKCFTYLSYI